ncbi:MAG: hypothetical protein KF862_24010 [Chitinophagaceae bacterium]|nr:hypothetical protein [Chitinophagaceae bacterium]
MKKIVCMTLLASIIGIAGFSQTDYKSAIGARLAPESYFDFFAFSYKTFITSAGALEFNAGGGSKREYYGLYHDSRKPFALSVSATYQHHFEIPVKGLRWFIGGGLAAYNAFSKRNEYEGFGFGFYPTGGADWKVPNVPLNLTVDYRPTIIVARPNELGDGFEPRNFGIAVRYTIGTR